MFHLKNCFNHLINNFFFAKLSIYRQNLCDRLRSTIQIEIIITRKQRSALRINLLFTALANHDMKNLMSTILAMNPLSYIKHGSCFVLSLWKRAS